MTATLTAAQNSDMVDRALEPVKNDIRMSIPTKRSCAAEHDDPLHPRKRLCLHKLHKFCEEYPTSKYAPQFAKSDLSMYIQHAEIQCFKHCTSEYPIFARAKGFYTGPQLCKDRVNRIIIFPGCFNPSHIGHLELLSHVFLRMDSSVVAAMIVPRGETSHIKDDTTIGGKPFSLTKQERKSLLDHPLLRRFCWIYIGRDTSNSGDRRRFQNTLISMADVEGYKLSFVSLSGSDHWLSTFDYPNLGFGHVDHANGDLITSDITRPSILMGIDTTKIPRQLPRCEPWRKVLPARGDAVKEEAEQTSCWPCLKFQMFALDRCSDGEPHTDPLMRHLASNILHRCHEGHGIIWTCTRRSGGKVWFVPSGRNDSVDEMRPTVSSSVIRKLLSAGPKDQMPEHVGGLALNAKKLLAVLGLAGSDDDTENKMVIGAKEKTG